MQPLAPKVVEHLFQYQPISDALDLIPFQPLPHFPNNIDLCFPDNDNFHCSLNSFSVFLCLISVLFEYWKLNLRELKELLALRQHLVALVEHSCVLCLLVTLNGLVNLLEKHLVDVNLLPSVYGKQVCSSFLIS